jgi:hypothetical protein
MPIQQLPKSPAGVRVRVGVISAGVGVRRMGASGRLLGALGDRGEHGKRALSALSCVCVFRFSFC